MEERFESQLVPGRYFIVRHDEAAEQLPAHRATSSAGSAVGALAVVGLVLLVAAALASD